MNGSVASFDVVAGAAPSSAVEAFNEDGVVGLRDSATPDWLATVEQGITAALSGASADLDVVKKDGDTGRFSFSSQAWRTVEPFRRFIFESPLPDLVWPFLQSSTLTLFYDFLLIKEAGSNSAATPWHQDHAYYPLQGHKVINCWTALDPIPEETALRFWKGSHRPGIVYRASNFEAPDTDYRHVRKERPAIPDIDSDASAEILVAPMEPGDMLIWSSRTFHAAPGNHLNQRRAAFSVNWAGDDVTYEDVAALETYRDANLMTGDRIEGEKFPLVRSA
ncbi:MAG: hypothetical protein CMM46_04945 [Rhodospirillaceae bacterium]|nr:hypothetical protein [Rhodospirillaceae bacterium]|tara:strand:- start:1040 stop:1873 length:834 start_codon:yes stop_codon:yes gene_type:complete